MKIPDWKWILKWRIVHPITHGHSYTKYYEQAVREAMFSLSGENFWDVGANTGYYTISLARRFDQVTAFEPNPLALKFLRHKIEKARLTNVIVRPLALSDSVGTSKLYTPTKVRSSSIGSVNSLISPKQSTAGIHSEGKTSDIPFVEVETNTLDNILGDKTVDLMKIDVEGAEFMVLGGGKKTLHDHRIKNLIVELHDWRRKNELDNLLSANQYDVKWLDFEPEASTCHVLATWSR